VGLGVYPDFSACRASMVKSAPLGENDPSLVSFYEEKYGNYCRLRSKILGV